MVITETAIEEVLRSADIEALIQLGAPKDEYESEARSIMDAVARLDVNEVTEESLTAIIRTEWSKWFGPFSDDEMKMRMTDFQRIARRILKLDA
jgi:hypothetical protein